MLPRSITSLDYKSVSTYKYVDKPRMCLTENLLIFAFQVKIVAFASRKVYAFRETGACCDRRKIHLVCHN